MNKEKILLIIDYFSRSLLIIIAIGLFIFALLSGSEKVGLIKNMPNALPWFMLIIFICIAFWKQIIGGLLIILFGLFTILFFSALQVIWILFIISLPIIILGSVIVFCGFLRRRI